MRKKNESLETTLERATSALRQSEPTPQEIEAAAARVWAKVGAREADSPAEVAPPAEGVPLRSCADHQALMPALVAGTLPPSRRLLVEDHTRECIPCRRALRAVRSGERVASEQSPSASRSNWLRIAATVTLVVAAGALAWSLWGLVPVSQEGVAEVSGVEGELYVVDQGSPRLLSYGDAIDGGRELRTAQNSSAVVRLSDGSVVEIAERSSVEFRLQRRGHRIRVARGSIIVEASEQGSGNLKVSTDDMLVAVTGTIFAVSHGTKGSRVSVVEGEVRVSHGRQEQTLLPGEQLGTSAAVAATFEEELGWSRNVDAYLAMLKELTELRRDLNELIGSHEPRYSTRLLDLAPASTVVYAALPNPTITMAEAYRMLRERMQANEQLASWWESEVEAAGFGSTLDDFVDYLRTLGEYLGDEVALTLSAVSGIDGGVESPLVLAEVTNRMALEVAISEKIAELEQSFGDELDGFRLRLVEEPLTASTNGEEMLIWVSEDVLVASSSSDLLREVARYVQGETNPFVGGRFHGRLAEAYAEGAEFLGGLDMASLLPHILAEEGSEELQALELFGLLDLEHLVVERQQDAERAHTSAVLNFTGDRRGVTAWLAEPGPMGSLDFVSPDASFAAAFVLEQPATILAELLALASSQEEDFDLQRARMEAELGFSIEDLVEPLGGEFAFAIDGPALPDPSWKLIVEVYDEQRLQYTLEQLVGRIVDGIDPELGGVLLESEEVGGRTFYRLVLRAKSGEEPGLTSLLDGSEVHYVYHDGYLVAGPTRALVQRALQLQEGGSSILQSVDFRELLPADGYLDVSGLVFNRLGEVVGSFVEKVASSQLELTPEQRQLVEEVAADAGPSLHCIYGERDRIRLTSNGPSALPFIGLGPLFGVSQAFDMMGGELVEGSF